MTRKTTITLFYTGVALICAGILSIAFWLRQGNNADYRAPAAINTGKVTVAQWFPIEKDLSATNQDGQKVKLSDLRGKVWLIAEFFAVCPNCAVRNGKALREVYDEFKNNPDFQVVCISVDPEDDNLERLADYSKALGADSKNWWFLNAGETKATHEYLENVLKFMKVRERTDPVDVESNGKYIHDMAFSLVDRDFQVVGKWDLADADSDFSKQIDPNMEKKLKGELYDRIRSELAKTSTAEND